MLRGRELDLAVAESLGWRYIKSFDGIYSLVSAKDAKFYVDAGVSDYVENRPEAFSFYGNWHKDVDYALQDCCLPEYLWAVSDYVREGERRFCITARNAENVYSVDLAFEEFSSRQKAYATGYCLTYLQAVQDV